ncbi:protein serine/threonine phosphatase 2C [Thozetella sp. PMI_491]|nr:protein serine/threonine phosphatase 2C [Thozetella sp. PMI_491]
MATTIPTTAARTLLTPCLPQARPLGAALSLAAPRSRPTGPTRSPRLARGPTRFLHETRRLSSTTNAMPKFTYNVAASYIAKGRPFDPTTHVFHFNPYNRVQPPKRNTKHSRPESGQDAFFVTRLGDSPNAVALGVADGVGGWMESGVDPADFSHALCDYMASAAYEHRAAEAAKKALTARQVIQKGYEAVCYDGSIAAGGSTAVVGLFTDDGMMEVANLGDSGYIHLRLNAVHACSEPQTHAFNTPYQLSVVPPSMLLRAAAFGGAQLMDQPRDAEVTRHPVRHGDVLVFASDGLWDNLFNQDILRIVSGTMTKSGAWAKSDAGITVAPDLAPYTQIDATTAAEAEQQAKSVGQRPFLVTLQSVLAAEIVGTAKVASVDAKRDGPFAKEVRKYYPTDRWQGGKEDDICVVVVVVSEEPVAPVKARL